MLKCLITKLWKSLSVTVPSGSCFSDENEEAATMWVPEDVAQGHFAVVAIKDEESKRFIVELAYLHDPDFLRLLEKAKEEFGFGRRGALAIPCRPQELQKILDDHRKLWDRTNINVVRK